MCNVPNTSDVETRNTAKRRAQWRGTQVRVLMALQAVNRSCRENGYVIWVGVCPTIRRPSIEGVNPFFSKPGKARQLNIRDFGENGRP